MDRRKKRTSTNQYTMYIDMMEKDPIFATGRVPRDVDVNYLQKKWKELSDKLNTCSSGPKLTAEEWRKRLNDWKNTTRCKYRRSLSGEKDISLTALELKALELFGKAPNVPTSSEQLSVHLKSEKEEVDEEMEHQRTSESFQKELQAVVDEAIGGDDEEDAIGDEHEEPEEAISDPLTNNAQVSTSGNSANPATTYRTIVVENTQLTDDDNNDEQLEFIAHRRQTMAPTLSTGTVATTAQNVVTSTPTATVTKLINGDIPLKRLRTQAPDQVIYEVKKAPVSQHTPRSITIQSCGTSVASHHQPQQQSESNSVSHYSG